MAGFAALLCVPRVHAGDSVSTGVFERAVDDGHAAVIGCARCGVTAVNATTRRTLRDGHLTRRFITVTAGLAFCRIARVNIPRGRNIGQRNFIACSVAIFGIACVQITRECRLIGKEYFVA